MRLPVRGAGKVSAGIGLETVCNNYCTYLNGFLQSSNFSFFLLKSVLQL